MTKWFEEHKNIILAIVLVLFMLCGIFYFFMVRPLAAEKENMDQELNRINEDAEFYQESIDQLLPQTFAEEEAVELVGSIPIQPNVEEIIKDVERTELETGTVIDHIAVSIHPNQWNGSPEADEQIEESQDLGFWGHLIPSSDLSNKLKDKITEVKELKVSYVEMAIDLNGKQEDVNQFVNKLENLQRIIHVQGFDYSINEERENRLEGILTIRAFYSEDFSNLIYDNPEFELDYQFDPTKIKRYIDKEKPLESSEPVASDGSNQAESLLNTDSSSHSDGWSNTGDTKNNEETDSEMDKTPSTGRDLGLDYYGTPEMHVDGIQPGDPVFHVVQTGAYTSSNYLFSAAQKLMEIGVYPRIIGDRMSYIYTAADSSVSSAQKIVDVLKGQGFDSYVKTLPYRLTVDDQKMLLTEVKDVVSSITVILTDGITQSTTAIEEKQYRNAAAQMKAYQMKAEEYMKNSSNEGRKRELQETVILLSKIDELLLEYNNNQKKETLWEAEALTLDFLLIFNSYVPVNVKG